MIITIGTRRGSGEQPGATRFDCGLGDRISGRSSGAEVVEQRHNL